MTGKEALRYGMTLKDVYQDKPFCDKNWVLVRHIVNEKAFLWIYECEDFTQVMIRVEPEWADFWRCTYESVLPGYHQNEAHWNAIILDGSVSDQDIKSKIEDSYKLTEDKKEEK